MREEPDYRQACADDWYAPYQEPFEQARWYHVPLLLALMAGGVVLYGSVTAFCSIRDMVEKVRRVRNRRRS